MARQNHKNSPKHPGKILVDDFLNRFGLTQVELAERMGVPFQRINRIVRGHRGLTSDSALRLARLFGTTPEYWMNLQQRWDFHEALTAPTGRSIGKVRPIRR